MDNDKQKNVSEEKIKEDFFERTKAKIKDTTIKTRVLSFIFVYGMFVVVFTTLVSLMLDPDTFTDEIKRNAWLVRTIIMVAISTFGIIIGEQMSIDILTKMKGGKYQATLEKYLEHRQKCLEYVNVFGDWFIWYKGNELKRKKISFLVNYGLTEMECRAIIENIDDISFERKKDEHGNVIPYDICLHPVVLSDGTEITRKNEVQAEAIKWVKEGHVTIETYSSNYFISKTENTGTALTIERAPILDKQENKELWFRRIYKIVAVVITSTISSMIVASDFMKGNDVQAWLNLFLRLGSLFGAFASGWVSGSKAKDKRVEKLEDKIDVLNAFEIDLEKHYFIPMTYEQRIRKEKEEYEHNRQSETLDEQAPQIHACEVTDVHTSQS